jgi:hypothetical protein
LLSHNERLLKSLVGEVVVLFESEDEVETIAFIVKLTGDVLEVHENGSVLLLNKSADTRVVDHSSEPEAWYSERAVLDFFHITRVSFNFLVIFII